MLGLHREDEEGFSVVELLITLVIIGTTFGAFMVIFTTIQTINKKALDIGTANSIAFTKMQDYENTPFGALPNTHPAGTLVQVEDFSESLPRSLEAPRTAYVYINSVSGSLKQIVVSIRFGSGADQRQIDYANFIQNGGLGR